MPPKLKSDADASPNEPVSRRIRTTGKEATASASTPTAVSSKAGTSASKAAPKSKANQTFKYSNPDTVSINPFHSPFSPPAATAHNQSPTTQLSKKPEYINLEWPNIEDFLDDEDHDMPEENEPIDSFCDRVSDLGIPISEEGAQLGEVKLDKEVEERDQDNFGMFIYND